VRHPPITSLGALLLTVWLDPGLLLAQSPSTPPPASAPETSTNTASHLAENPESLANRRKQDFQVRTNSSFEVSTSTNGSHSINPGFYHDFSWRGWNGLHLEVSQRTPLKSPREMLGLRSLSNAPVSHLEQLKMSVNFGAVFELDGAAYRTSGSLNIPDDIQLRRGLLRFYGDFILVLPVSYMIEFGYVPHKFNLNKAWLSSDHINYLGYLVVGVFQPPMGLDMMTSSRDISFMEPASVLQALAPGNEAGIRIGQPFGNYRATWSLGIFAGGVTEIEYGNASRNYGNLIGRLTWLPISHLAPPDRPDENELLHFGLSANLQYSPSSVVEYRSRPESYLAPRLIDTGTIGARASGEVAGEAAYVNGPFSVQGEFIDSYVRGTNGADLNFYGFYASASWFLTGESRPYDPVNGQFKRLVPLRNFDFGRGGAWGAFQAGVRFSYTDLDSGDVRGGRMGLLMGELNWYLHSHVRWMFNGGVGRTSGGARDGNLTLFQTRIGVDF